MSYAQKMMSYISRIPRNKFLCRRHSSSLAKVLRFSDEVQVAKSAGQPVVALESTIITHGMPYPQNLETALQVENIIRERGAVPATIAILKGEIHIGLSGDQLKYLAQAKGVVKASRRDLAPVIAAKKDGATTVAGTIIASELADIPVFVTGGIGGVHRDGESSLDVSADLTELGRSRTVVVCSGVKSILDIGRTLEYLETQGVCVCSFGNSDDFPAFYTRSSGHRAPHRASHAIEAAKIAYASRMLQLNSGVLIAVPIPEEHAMKESVIENAINRALEDANTKDVKGKDVTPFILAAVAEATAGASLSSNIALIKNNASVGADIAVEFNKLRNSTMLKNASHIGISNSSGKFTRGFHTSCRAFVENKSPQCGDGPLLNERPDRTVVVIGGSNMDRTYQVEEDTVKVDGSTHACAAAKCAGGVGRNMADALWRLRGKDGVSLITAVGDDSDGQYLRETMRGVILDGCTVKGGRTASYAGVLDSKGECLLGLGDMALHDHISVDLVSKHLDVIKSSPLVVMDGNVPQDTINFVLQICHQHDIPVFFEPTDRRKASKILRCGEEIKTAFASPNINELRAMANTIKPEIKPISEDNHLREILLLADIIAPYVNHLLVTAGSQGVVSVNNRRAHGSINSKARFYPVDVIKDVVSVSGAGDCFNCGFIYGMLLGLNEVQCISLAFQTAGNALRTKDTVPNSFELSYNHTEAKFRLIH